MLLATDKDSGNERGNGWRAKGQISDLILLPPKLCGGWGGVLMRAVCACGVGTASQGGKTADKKHTDISFINM